MKKIVKGVLYCLSLILFVIFNPLTIFLGKTVSRDIATINAKIRLKKCGKHFKVGLSNTFEGLKYVTVGDNFNSMDGLWLSAYKRYGGNEYSPCIEIGDNVHLSRNCHIGAIGKVTVGDNVLIGSNVLINDHSHGETADFSENRVDLPLVSKGDISIGENTWICDNAVILGGVHIGRNCVVGANAVVTKSFTEEGCVIAGNPARVVKICPVQGKE